MKTFIRFAILVLAVFVAGCDKAQLLAPTSSTISVSASTRVLPLGGSVEVTAFVLEQAGTPVQNGTTVRFTTSLGTVSPAEAQTRNGLAVTTFHAGNVSGVAQVRAVSGAATGSTTSGTGTGATTTTANVVEITIGAAAATRVALSASPTTVSSSGGTSEVTATVLDGSGNVLSGVPVVFSTTAGSLSSSTANTDSSGRATVTLTTNRAATVTARAGGGTSAPSAEIAITAASPPSVSLTVSPASPAAGQPVTLTITPGGIGTGTPAPRAVVNWGDGSQEDIGAVASARSVAHTYSSAGSYTITVRATTEGESTTASAGVLVGLPPSVTVSATPTSGPAASTTFAFTITPAASANPQNVRIDFGDGSDAVDLGAVTSATTVTRRYNSAGQYTVRVTQTNINGSSTTAVVVVTAT